MTWWHFWKFWWRCRISSRQNPVVDTLPAIIRPNRGSILIDWHIEKNSIIIRAIISRILVVWLSEVAIKSESVFKADPWRCKFSSNIQLFCWLDKNGFDIKLSICCDMFLNQNKPDTLKYCHFEIWNLSNNYLPHTKPRSVFSQLMKMKINRPLLFDTLLTTFHLKASRPSFSHFSVIRFILKNNSSRRKRERRGKWENPEE